MQTTFHGLRTAIYFVTDIPKATEWYAAILGIQPYFNEAYYVGFNVGGYELGLHPADKKAEITGKSIEIYWGVDDVETAYNNLLAADAAAFDKPANVGGDIIVATVKDPWGNVFGIIQNPHFKLPA